MNNNTSKKNLITRMMVLLAVLFGNAALTMAANTIYVEDFSINAGEEKLVNICLDNEDTEIYIISGYISLPEGLEFQPVNGNNYLGTVTGRTNGFMSGLNTVTHQFSVAGIMNPIAGNSGAIATFKVKATNELAKNSSITLSDCVLKHLDGSEEALTIVQNKVNRADIGGDGGTVSFSVDKLIMGPGEETEIGLVLTNEGELTGIDATVSLPTGVTATFTPTARFQGSVGYNSNTGKLIALSPTAPIEVGEGAIFTIKLTADETVADGNVQLSNIHLTNASSVSFDVDPVSIPLTAKDAASKEALDAALENTVQEKLDAAQEAIEENGNADDYQDPLDALKEMKENLEEEIQENYDNATLDRDAEQEKIDDLADAIDALVADSEANKLLQEKVDELQQALEDAKNQIQQEYGDVADQFVDAENDIKTMIDNLQGEIDEAADKFNSKDYLDNKMDAKVNDIETAIAAMLAEAKDRQEAVTGIEAVKTVEAAEYYTLGGVRTSNAKGIVLVKTANGVKKVMK